MFSYAVMEGKTARIKTDGLGTGYLTHVGLLRHPKPHPKSGAKEDVKQNHRVKDQSVQDGFLSD